MEQSSESDYSDSSGSSLSENSSCSSSSSQSDGIEVAKILTETLSLPKGLCEDSDIFNEFFTLETWKMIPENIQTQLKNKFLPHFPENNEFEQEETIHMLFNNQINRFDKSPLKDFQKNLVEGNYRPDVLKLRESIAKSRRREQRFKEYEEISKMAKILMVSREKLLRKAINAPPDTEIKMNTHYRSNILDPTITAVKSRKRYHRELYQMANDLGLSDDLSDIDLDDVEREVNKVNTQSSSFAGNETKIISTMNMNNHKNEECLDIFLSHSAFKKILREHKRRKVENVLSPEFDTSDIRLRDVHARAQIAGPFKKSLLGKHSLKKVLSKQEINESIPATSSLEHTSKQIQLIELKKRSDIAEDSFLNSQIISESEEDVNIASNRTSVSSYEDIFKNAKQLKKKKLNVSSVENKLIGMSGNKPNDISISSVNNLSHYHGKIKKEVASDMQLDITRDLNNDFNYTKNILPNVAMAPELMQETHACFLSLIRDIFCSTPNHRMKLIELKDKICIWLSNPITALNNWYSLAENWLMLVTSAINFLAGDCADQPEDFVPYIEFKPNQNIYQWIGAGRDSDNHLMQLCDFWMDHKNEMYSKPAPQEECIQPVLVEVEENTFGERVASPPPPRCPTTWTVKPATIAETQDFQVQERRRFESPHKSFTYRQHGYESVVGPVKGIYTQMIALTKARGHTMLVGERPNFVTILTLVRDATARLPNGEGTRTDICELLKSSQYINTEASENVLQTIVSGALDRMHTEYDPCVRYDTKRKMWIYLHRNRTEEEFEKMHQQFQGVGKHKRQLSRKSKSKMIVTGKSENPLHNQDQALTPNLVKATIITTRGVQPVLANSVSTSNTKTEYTTIVPENNSKPTVGQEISKNLKKDNRLGHNQISQVDLEAREQLPAETITDARPIQFVNIQKSKKPSGLLATSTLPIGTNKTQIRVATPTGIKTVNVSVASTPTMLTINNSGTTTTTQKQVSPQINQLVATNKKFTQQITNQNPISAKLITSQSQNIHHQNQQFIIPILNNSEQFKVITSMPNTLLASTNNQGGKNHSSVISNRQLTEAQIKAINLNAGKNFVKFANIPSNSKVTAKLENVGPKTIVSPASTGNITIQPTQQKVFIQQQQQQLQNPKTVTGVSVVNNNNASPMLRMPQKSINQQKQLIQTIMNQQQKQRLVTVGNLQQTVQNVIIPQQQQGQQTNYIQGKNIIIQHQNSPKQKSQTFSMPPSSSNQTDSKVANTSNSSGINQQVIQIHTSTGIPGTTGKIQTINANSLTPQQQQNIIQSLKQQQQHHSLIVKQQQLFNPPQSSQSPSTPSSISVSMAKVLTKPITTVVGSSASNVSASNVIQTQAGSINLLKHSNLLQQSQQGTTKSISQPQTVTRVFKSGTFNQNNTVSGIRTQSGQPIVAKVLTNNAGQIISIENLLQKQSTNSQLRITNAKPSQSNLIHLAGPTGSQINQYSVVSQGQIISMSPQQSRVVMSQPTQSPTSSSSTNLVKSNTIVPIVANKIQDVKNTTTIVRNAIKTKMISANQIQPITAQQLINAKLLGKAVQGQSGTSNIRMVNASNFNITNFRGKPVIISNKQGTVTAVQGDMNNSGQNMIIHNSNIVIGGQTLKLQGNVLSPANVQIMNQQGSPLRHTLQNPQSDQSTTSDLNSGAGDTAVPTSSQTKSGTIVLNCSPGRNQNIANSVMLGSSSQALRVQSPLSKSSTSSNLNSITARSTGPFVSQPGQHILLGSTVKGTTLKSANSTPQRVVLAVQSGGQIILPPGYQGGPINIKSLQGVKVISIPQQQSKVAHQQSIDTQSDTQKPTSKPN